MVELRSGDLLIAAMKHASHAVHSERKAGGGRLIGFHKINPTTGIRGEQFVESNELNGFIHPSPDGKLWLRHDRSSLPVTDVLIDPIGWFRRPEKQRLFGVTIQVWKADPICYVKTLTTTWLPLEKMPSLTNSVADDTEHRKIWEMIEDVTTKSSTRPTASTAAA